MEKLCFFLLVAVFFAVVGKGQAYHMSGIIRDSATAVPLAGAQVTNKQSKQTVTSNEKGYFRLPAAPDDLVEVRAGGYETKYLMYSTLFSDTMTVALQKAAALLPGVTVTTPYNKYQVDSMRRRIGFDRHPANRMKTVAPGRSEGFGLTLNLDRLFKKQYRNRNRNARLFHRLEEQAYVDFRFPADKVARYTGLRGEALRQFMHRYRPSYEWLRRHPAEEELLYYISDRLKEFRKSGLGGLKNK